VVLNKKEFAAKEKLEIVLFASASGRVGRKGGSVGIPPAEPVNKIGSDFFKYTPPIFTFWVLTGILDEVRTWPKRHR